MLVCVLTIASPNGYGGGASSAPLLRSALKERTYKPAIQKAASQQQQKNGFFS